MNVILHLLNMCALPMLASNWTDDINMYFNVKVLLIIIFEIVFLTLSVIVWS